MPSSVPIPNASSANGPIVGSNSAWIRILIVRIQFLFSVPSGFLELRKLHFSTWDCPTCLIQISGKNIITIWLENVTSFGRNLFEPIPELSLDKSNTVACILCKSFLKSNENQKHVWPYIRILLISDTIKPRDQRRLYLEFVPNGQTRPMPRWAKSHVTPFCTPQCQHDLSDSFGKRSTPCSFQSEVPN